MMRRVILVLSALFWAAIIFFTAFGNKLYSILNPKVSLDISINYNNGQYLPKTAVFEESDGAYVYTVESEQGFSREILTARRHKLKGYLPDDTGYFEGYVKIVPEEAVNGIFVISSSKPLHDGAKVIQEDV